MALDLCCDISWSPVESVEPAEQALRGRFLRDGEGGRRSTPTGGGSVQRRTVHCVGLSFTSRGIIMKRVMWR